jgi:hypothetical protein
MFVKPAEGRTVPDPETGTPLPTEGAFVRRSGFWVRRVKSGDAVEAAPPKGAKAPKATPPAPPAPAEGVGRSARRGET